MGEFTGFDEEPVQSQEPVEKPSEYNTDVPDVKANDVVKHGSLEFPVFDCSRDEFFQNSEYGRRRLHFNPDSSVHKYMQNSKQRIPFYIRYIDDSGKAYTKKIK